MTEHEKLLNMTAAEIAALTSEMFESLMDRIRDGEDPQTAIAAIMETFDPEYREALAAAFSVTLAESIGDATLRDMPIGSLTLSQRLYQHAESTSAAVREIINAHTAGFQSARELALQIYEGYGFKNGEDPLKWPAGSPKWPKYMQQTICKDPAAFAEFIRIAKKMAGNLKTEALKAGYLEALDALEKGAGDAMLKKKMEIAFEERMRYFANRIAQTELHRAYMDKMAEEIMEDDTIEAVKVVMSATHPEIDICDLYATQNKYGLGQGVYPKAVAPRPPFHPFCRCVLHSKRMIKTDGARENTESERQFLRSLGVKDAAKVIGSRGKLEAVMQGDDVTGVLNAGKPRDYWYKTVGS